MLELTFDQGLQCRTFDGRPDLPLILHYSLSNFHINPMDGVDGPASAREPGGRAGG